MVILLLNSVKSPLKALNYFRYFIYENLLLRTYFRTGHILEPDIFYNRTYFKFGYTFFKGI